MKSGVKMTKDGLKGMLKTLMELPVQSVLVGIPAENGEREAGDPMTNAALGYINENGSPALNIPARPWLVPGIRDAQKKITGYLKQAGQYAFNGDQAGIERALNAAGLAGQTAAKAKINTGPFQALAEATLAARRRRGRTGEKPLIDTGQMRNSVTYVIRGKP